MSIDAMKMALEALEGLRDLFYQDTIEALRTAIEAAEKVEPVAWLDLVKVKNGMAYATTVKITSKQTPLYATPQPAIPAGWQLVPVEPTPEMLAATTTISMLHGTWTDAYKAMLQVAPKPENSHE